MVIAMDQINVVAAQSVAAELVAQSIKPIDFAPQVGLSHKQLMRRLLCEVPFSLIELERAARVLGKKWSDFTGSDAA